MSDPGYAHEYDPRRKDGKCKVFVGGRSCHEPADAAVHTRWRHSCSDGVHSTVTVEVHCHEEVLVRYVCQDCGAEFEGRLT